MQIAQSSDIIVLFNRSKPAKYDRKYVSELNVEDKQSCSVAASC